MKFKDGGVLIFEETPIKKMKKTNGDKVIDDFISNMFRVLKIEKKVPDKKNSVEEASPWDRDIIRIYILLGDDKIIIEVVIIVM